MRFAILAILCAAMLTGASSCEEKAAEQYGITIVPDPANPGKYKVVADPNKGNVGTVLQAAGDVTGGVPIAGQVVGGLAFASNLLYTLLLRRAKARVDAMNAEHTDTHDATNQGLQSFVDAQPKAVGDALIAALDKSHDANDVPAVHQDAIQPVAKAA